jgi:cytoskeleton protein RodZ
MNSIGDTLRRERQRRNLDLPRIAAQLKISVRFLEAMEQDDFAKLPGGVFTKSFVRQYAAFLGLETDELVAEVNHAVEPEPDVAQLADKPKPDVPGMELEVGDESWHSVRERRASLPSSVKAGILLVALMLACSGAYYWWWQRPRHLAHETAPAKTTPVAQPAPVAAKPAENPPQNPAPTVATTSTPPPQSTPAAADSASRQATTEASLVPAVPTPKPEVPVVPPNPNATVRVSITADEAVWIRADVNGKFQFQGTLQPHESRDIDADGQVTLRLGNAGGATLVLNGKPVGLVGPKGQIRIVQFTSGGFQIVSLPRLVDPLDRL